GVVIDAALDLLEDVADVLLLGSFFLLGGLGVRAHGSLLLAVVLVRRCKGAVRNVEAVFVVIDAALDLLEDVVDVLLLGSFFLLGGLAHRKSPVSARCSSTG